MTMNLHIVVDLNLGEEGYILRIQSEGNIPTAISRAALDPLPILDSRHHRVYTFLQEMVHVLARQLGLDTDMFSFS